jgi:hypothetical protein
VPIWLTVLSWNAVAGVVLTLLVYLCDRWSMRRRAAWFEKSVSICNAVMIGALVFFALSFRLIPTWFDAGPLLFAEQLGRLAFAALAAFVVHELLLRLMIRS